MSPDDIEKLKAEREQLLLDMSGGMTFTDAMRATTRLNEIEKLLAIVEPKPRTEREPIAAKEHKFSEVRQPKKSRTAPSGRGHDPYAGIGE